MSGVAKSQPPVAPASQARAKYLPRKPVLKLRHPLRYEGRVWAAELFDRFLKHHGVSSGAIATYSGINERTIDEMRRGEKPINAGDWRALLPRRLWAAWASFYAGALVRHVEHS